MVKLSRALQRIVRRTERPHLPAPFGLRAELASIIEQVLNADGPALLRDDLVGDPELLDELQATGWLEAWDDDPEGPSITLTAWGAWRCTVHLVDHGDDANGEPRQRWAMMTATDCIRVHHRLAFGPIGLVPLPRPDLLSCHRTPDPLAELLRREAEARTVKGGTSSPIPEAVAPDPVDPDRPLVLLGTPVARVKPRKPSKAGKGTSKAKPGKATDAAKRRAMFAEIGKRMGNG